MIAVTAFLAVAAVASLGFLAIIVMLHIGMRTEGSHLSPSSAPHTRIESANRRLLGVYVRRELEKTRVQYEDVRR
jgi:hypothetical protein